MGVAESLGLRIKELRKKKGLTQDKVAEQAGITGKYMGMIERGEVNVSVKILENLAEVFEVRVADFFVFENQIPPEEIRNELIKLVEEATESELQLLSEFVRSVLK